MKHLDIGTIHAFLDGELSGEHLEFAASHFSLCEACSNLMLEAENESDAVMQAFAVENVYAVPTQRIWARINNEIDAIEAIPAPTPQPISVWQKAFGWLGFDNLSQVAAPTAALGFGVVIVAFFSIYGILQPANVSIDAPPIAKINEPAVTFVTGGTSNSNLPSETQTAVAPNQQPSSSVKIAAPRKSSGGFEAVNASYRVEPKAKTVVPKVVKTPGRNVDLNTPIVEERLYLDAINDLSETVASNDEALSRPSVRVEYEQNIALINQAIQKMQRQVRRNPNDENAKRILFASYQNKIDLLNTVAEKSQLMATLR
jgi:anti-sigma factor RsiW